MDRLDRAIRDFEDETLDLTMGERISNLRSALTWAAFERLKRIQKLGKKAPESEELDFKQIECQKQFKLIDQMYTSQLRHNKLLGKALDDGMGKDFLKQLKGMKSSIGEIIAKIPVNVKAGDERNN